MSDDVKPLSRDEFKVISRRRDMRGVSAIETRRLIATVKALLEDRELLDWMQSLLSDGQQIMIDRQELVPDEGGESFMGVAITIGPVNDFCQFAGGAADLRDAIGEARENRSTKRSGHGAKE